MSIGCRDIILLHTRLACNAPRGRHRMRSLLVLFAWTPNISSVTMLSTSSGELQSVIAYKAALAGNMTVKVDAAYTSQMCPVCGYTSKDNRPAHGLLFVCQNCQYTLHADLIGARNVSLRTLLIRQDWMSTGVLSVRPDVSDSEAKAARLQRYAELRWSPDTSPVSLDLG